MFRRAFLGLACAALLLGRAGSADKPEPGYAEAVRPFLAKYCLSCHSTKARKGSLDLERFSSLDLVRADLKPWLATVELVEAGEMPPKGKPQPSALEKKRLLAWLRGFLDAEGRARAGDPGHVPLRRLGNAEYDNTIRDLTGVDLKPTREFPADGAAGEGFANAAEALSDISPALLAKYLDAAHAIADHAILLPDGFRFSSGKTRRDWTDEATSQLRAFYAGYSRDGKLPLRPYLQAAVRLRAGKSTVEQVAVREKLDPRYLRALWQVLDAKEPSHPLDLIRARFRAAAEKDVPALEALVAAWQGRLWRTVPIGSYRNGDSPRQVAVDPQARATAPLSLTVKPVPGESAVVLRLSASGKGRIAWSRPRLEAPGKPALLLRDYPEFGPAHEIDHRALFADAAAYLAAVRSKKKAGLDAGLLQRWTALLALEPGAAAFAPASPLRLLDEKLARSGGRPAINGWKKKGTDLPVLLANSSAKEERIPGTVAAGGVAVHPMPQELVAVAWTSPLAGRVRISGNVRHSHPACGNGVAWFLEQRRAAGAAPLAQGVTGLGGASPIAARTLAVKKGDQVVLAIDARDGNHVCDLTQVGLTITEEAKPGRKWDLAGDIAPNVLAGNPHGAWSFLRGPARPTGQATAVIPPASVLGRWRVASAADAPRLAAQAQALLSGPRPAKAGPDQQLYDRLVGIGSPLFQGMAPARLARPGPKKPGYGLKKESFDGTDLLADAGSAIEIRLPAALFQGRTFAVDGKLVGGNQGPVSLAAQAGPARAEGLLGTPGSAARLKEGYEAFRRVFPLYLCFPQVIPTDEVVCLKMFHREDEPLKRLFLDAAQKARLERLWAAHRFVSRQPLAENAYLPQFIGFVTQDQPKELLRYYEGMRPVFRKRAEQFEKEAEAAVPRQMEELLAFAERAYRRPLAEKEKAALLALHAALRKKGMPHDEAFRKVLARVLVSPKFLFRIEKAPPGKKAGPVDDWELATRLSYFLWASQPDEELRRLAAAGKLREKGVLDSQARRMLKDGRTRALAVEFGTQWLHVRHFDRFDEKNEKVFPTFDAAMRKAMYEESILFFQDLFQAGRPVGQILDCDHAFLNEALAKHYGIPGVKGPAFRRVEGVRKHGRGGVLGLGSVLAKESAASRTSPVLRGNWVVETLLGEKLPRPPKGVPELPAGEGGADKLTVRQLVEQHAKAPSCAVCHVRIDPFGFALEGFDAIGRRRAKDLGGLPVDVRATLKDGTTFEGIDGLRGYLLTKKRDVVERLFCRRLLGYALGRAVDLSDTSLIDKMMAEMRKNEGRVTAAVLAIVASPQFRMVRGAAHE